MELKALLTRENQAPKAEVSEFEKKLCDEKSRFRDMWHTNCQCSAECDEEITAKNVEIEELKRQLHSLTVASNLHAADMLVDSSEAHGRREICRPESVHPVGSRAYRGKAPLVDPFTGKDLEIHFDKWLPSLE